MKIPAVSALIFLALVACASGQASFPLPFFPQVAPQPLGLDEIWLTAAFDGTVVVEDGCVKVRSPDTKRSTTVLWYQGIELGQDESGLFLRAARDGNVTRFETPSKFGGGSVPPEHMERDYPAVARRCGPPYAYGYPSGAYNGP
jgi:hypothetical protein